MANDKVDSQQRLYRDLAKYYDKIYSRKNYQKESGFISQMIGRHSASGGKALLDLGCGTGSHMKHLMGRFDITGVDMNSGMLAIARKKNPGIKFIKGDMRKFDLKRKFDAVIWMFTLVNYNPSRADLEKSLACITRHMKKGGVLIFDVGLSDKSSSRHQKMFMETYEDKSLSLVRISQWLPDLADHDKYNAKFVFLIKDGKKIDFAIDDHELGVFPVSYLSDLLSRKYGYKVSIYANYEDRRFNPDSEAEEKPVFVCVKK